MSVAVLLQALGWVCVGWLLTVHLMIQHGRLPQGGTAYRVAGCAAALSVVLASVVEEIWPVAVLGLLWLRIEVFGHRHPGAEEADASAGSSRIPEFLAGALARGEKHSEHSAAHSSHPPHPSRAGAPHPPQSAHPSHPHHLPHPHLGPRAVNRVFKVEMGVVLVIAVVLFVLWAEQQRESFSRTTDYTVCNWIEGC